MGGHHGQTDILNVVSRFEISARRIRRECHQKRRDFNGPFQELVTEYCWGAVWGREGLSKQTRSLLNLAMISALNRPHELKMHVKGALNNGVTRNEIREVFMQVAIYCGVPAAVDSFRSAREVFAQIDGKVG